MDTNVSPQYGVTNWNETRWNGCWNSEQGVGIYIHAGRYRHDLDIWWVQVAAYLPAGELVVDRFWGPNASEAGIKVGCLDLEIIEDGWEARFDGAGQLTTTAALARAPRGGSAPFRRLRFDITATGAASQWDMYAGTTERLDFAAATHVQQGFNTSGLLRVGAPDEDQYRLDGVGFKDHSSGPRSFDAWYGHRFFLIVGEDWVCHAIGMYTPDGQAMAPWGALIRGGVESKLTRFELPLMADAEGGPVAGRLLIATESGEVLEFDTELLHALPMTITVDNDNINGVDWELEGDPIVIVEGKGKLTAADGSVAYCFHERSAVRSLLPRPA